MSRVRRVVAGGVASALMLSVAAFPALANNDGTVPADDCSGNPNTVGQPVNDQNDGGEPNATDHGPAPVTGPASDFNALDVAQGFPSEQAVLVTDGAQGNRSQAIDNCN